MNKRYFSYISTYIYVTKHFYIFVDIIVNRD